MAIKCLNVFIYQLNCHVNHSLRTALFLVWRRKKRYVNSSIIHDCILSACYLTSMSCAMSCDWSLLNGTKCSDKPLLLQYTTDTQVWPLIFLLRHCAVGNAHNTGMIGKVHTQLGHWSLCIWSLCIPRGSTNKIF